MERQYEIVTDRCPDKGTTYEYRYLLTISDLSLKKMEMTFEDFEKLIPTMRVFKDFSYEKEDVIIDRFIVFFWKKNDEQFVSYSEHWYEYLSSAFKKIPDMSVYLEERQKRVDYITSKEFRDKVLDFMKNELPISDPDHETDEEYFCELSLWANKWDCREEQVLSWKIVA